MKRFAIYSSIALCLLFSARRVSSQAYGQVSEEETLNSNGWLSIELSCYGYGDWSDPDDNNPNQEGQDYAGVSIGSSTSTGCQLNDPNGQSTSQDSNGAYFGGETLNIDLPVTASGTWQYRSSAWMWLWPCDSDYEDCFDGYPYDDPWGYTAYAGDPVNCPLNGGLCEGLYDGGDYVTTYDGLEYAYSGASPGVFGTFYVDALAIDIAPSSYTLDAGEQVALSGEASNTGDFLPFFQWTLSGPGSGTPSGSYDEDYTYTAPSQVSPGNTTATIKGCVTNLTSTPVCQTVTVDLIAETISIETPSPGTLLANGTSTSALFADISNGPPGVSVAPWSASVGSAPVSTGDTAATYTAPTTASAFPSGSANSQVPVTITGCIGGASPAICNTNTLTLVEPVSITGVTPATLSAGTTTQATINGGGFGPTGSTPSVTFSSTSWGPISINSPCSATNNSSISCPSVTIPANLSNMTGTQPITITVSTTTAGIPTQATYSVNVTPIAYTYSISLLPNISSLTYGYGSTITPTVTCKVATTGAACAGNVYNPQEANFSITNGIGLGSLSNTSNASSTVFTDTALISYPPLNATVQGCASIATNICATTNFSIPATSITLNPATLSSPLTGGKTQSFSANVGSPGMANQLSWTLTPSPSSAAPGTLTSSTTTVTGSQTSGTSSNTYTAPATITTLTTVVLNACMTANRNICATPVAIALQPAPTFSVTDMNNNPSQTALSLGHSMSYTVTVSALYGFSGPVTLSASGLPAGVTAQFSPASITTSGSSTLTLTSAYSNSTFTGNSTLNVTGTSGSTAQSAVFTLTTQPLQYKGYCGVQ